MMRLKYTEAMVEGRRRAIALEHACLQLRVGSNALVELESATLQVVDRGLEAAPAGKWLITSYELYRYRRPQHTR